MPSTTFTVETGTGLTDSTSYASVATFKAYHDLRGQSYAAYSDTQIQRGLVLATDYLDMRFDFVGRRMNDAQSLEWPRYQAYYPDGRPALNVPDEVIEACCEYALRAMAAPLAPDPSVDSSGRLVDSFTQKVGPLENTKSFSRGGIPQTIKDYPAADMRLTPLIHNGRRVLRA